MRKVMSFNEFFDIMDDISSNAPGAPFVTIGYVTGANLNVPKVKRRNPATNRMKGYDDYTQWGDNIGALVQITTYNFPFRTREQFAKHYGQYINDFNKIRSEFNLDPVRTKSEDEKYTKVQDYGLNGVKFYKGDDETKAGHTYRYQNVHNARVDSDVYAVDTNGRYIRKLDKKTEVYPFLKERKPVDGVGALKKMNADEETIQRYIDKVAELKFRAHPFEANSILFAVATVNGEKIIYINERLSRAVNDINIQPDEFIKLVKQKYNIAVNENRIMKKKLIKLTESDIHNIVMNTVRSLIKEEPLMPADVQDNETDMTLDDHKTTGNYTNDARILLATLADILDELDEQQPEQGRQDALWNEFMEKLEHLNDIAEDALNDVTGNIVDTEYENA